MDNDTFPVLLLPILEIPVKYAARLALFAGLLACSPTPTASPPPPVASSPPAPTERTEHLQYSFPPRNAPRWAAQ